jgi:hypothetical protein
MDQFTKWVEAYAVPDQTAITTVKRLLEFILRLGFPIEIHTDQGRNFESELFQTACKLLQITKTRTTPYRPSSNGQVERFNRSLLKMVCCYVDNKQDDWDCYIDFLTSAYRQTVHRMTGFTPNKLMLNRETRNLLDLQLGVESISEQKAVDFVIQVNEEMEKAHETARRHLKAAQLSQKKGYDLRKRLQSFQIGDLVLQRDLARKKGYSPKLQAVGKGPFVVKSLFSPDLYQIADKKKQRVVHHDSLKIYGGTTAPLGIQRLRHELLDLVQSSQKKQDTEIGEKGESLSPDLYTKAPKEGTAQNELTINEVPPLMEMPMRNGNMLDQPDWRPRRICARRRRQKKMETDKKAKMGTAKEEEFLPECLPPSEQITRSGRLSKRPQKLGI